MENHGAAVDTLPGIAPWDWTLKLEEIALWRDSVAAVGAQAGIGGLGMAKP